MPRKPRTPDVPDGLGELDGEAIAAATIGFSGTGHVDRRYTEGERVVLIVEGTVTGQVNIKRDGGRLIRTHKVKVTSVAPPAGMLGDEVEQFLADFNDALEGRTRLPFDDDETTEGDDDATD